MHLPFAMISLAASFIAPARMDVHEKDAAGYAIVYTFPAKMLRVSMRERSQHDSDFDSGYLKNAKICRLGQQEFLVGDVVDGKSSENGCQGHGVTLWLPLSRIAEMAEFSGIDRAGEQHGQTKETVPKGGSNGEKSTPLRRPQGWRMDRPTQSQSEAHQVSPITSAELEKTNRSATTATGSMNPLPDDVWAGLESKTVIKHGEETKKDASIDIRYEYFVEWSDFEGNSRNVLQTTTLPKSMLIPFRIDPLQCEGIKKLILMQSLDRGRTWHAVAESTPAWPLFKVSIDGPGTRCFAVQTLMEDGRKLPRQAEDLTVRARLSIK